MHLFTDAITNENTKIKIDINYDGIQYKLVEFIKL